MTKAAHRQERNGCTTTKDREDGASVSTGSRCIDSYVRKKIKKITVARGDKKTCTPPKTHVHGYRVCSDGRTKPDTTQGKEPLPNPSTGQKDKANDTHAIGETGLLPCIITTIISEEIKNKQAIYILRSIDYSSSSPAVACCCLFTCLLLFACLLAVWSLTCGRRQTT